MSSLPTADPVLLLDRDTSRSNVASFWAPAPSESVACDSEADGTMSENHVFVGMTMHDFGSRQINHLRTAWKWGFWACWTKQVPYLSVNAMYVLDTARGRGGVLDLGSEGRREVDRARDQRKA
jgi:hypothetical protein